MKKPTEEDRSPEVKSQEVESPEAAPASPVAEQPQLTLGASAEPMGETAPSEEPASAPAGAASSTAPQSSGAAPVGASQQDTLAWAKAAYARLKAEQLSNAAAAHPTPPAAEA
ncbi:MAG: hypothetical protein F4157_04405, partial [Synechococcus sp. SB0675_bin_6]|nr:hypothetical protein [Synechococcus sp. SB0675_bin_6]